MKNLLTATLPALALLALGGCATTGAVTSTEDDGVYYSSKDRTTVATAPAATGYQSNGYGAGTQVPTDENANPDYQGSTAQSGTTSTDYYDDNYNSVSPSGFGQPYTGPGVSSYNYTPNWSASPAFYGSPFGYGAGLSMAYGYGGFGGYSPFGFGYGYPAYAGFYDPFYSPFYSPFGYGSGFSIGFGYGFGGFGGFGHPFYGGYGYPGYAYNTYGYGGGYGDYYGGYGGARRYVYKQDIVSGRYSNTNGYDRGSILVGRRESRAVNAANSSGAVAPGGGAVGSSVPGGRITNGGAASGFNRVMAPGGNQPASGYTGNAPANAAAPADGGRRFERTTVNPNSPGTVANRERWGRMNNGGNSSPDYNQPRTAESVNPAASAPQQNQRGGFFRGMFAAPAGGGNANNQGGYSQPQRAYSQPQRPFPEQRSFSQPEQRSYSQPRMEQRSFQPAPSFGGGGGGGGGSFGGGGGGGGGRRGR